MENRNSHPKLTDTDWIKRVSPERRAHKSDANRSPSPGRIEVLVESVEEIEVKRKQSKSRKRVNERSEQDEIGLITKVTGKEFIPKGTVELEPMPLVDDFQFSSRYFKDLFVEDQRKIKEIRRKQYGDKDYDRVRDFVMIKLEALKSEIIAVLRQHFDSHKRSMNKREIEESSQKLKIDSGLFKKIHDEYKAWWIKNRSLHKHEHRKLDLYLAESPESNLRETGNVSSPSKQIGTIRSSSGLLRTMSKDSKNGQSWEMTKDESLEKKQFETEEEAEMKRQKLLELQRQSRRTRLADRKDIANDSSPLKKSKTPQDVLPIGMTITERSHRLNEMEKKKKLAEKEASELRKQLEELRKKNEAKERREFSKEKMTKSKSQTRQPLVAKVEPESNEKPKTPNKSKEDDLLKTISSLQSHLKDSHQKRSVEKLQRDRTNEKLREELWLAKAEEEGLRRRLQRAEEELEAERNNSLQTRNDHLKHSSPDRSSKGRSPDSDHIDDSEVGFCYKSEEEESRRLAVEKERQERLAMKRLQKMKEDQEKALREARAAQLARDQELERQRDEEIKRRQDLARRRLEEQRLKEIEEETRRMELAKDELNKLKQSLDFERSQMFAQRKAESIRKQKQKRAGESPTRASLSPRETSPQDKKVKFVTPSSNLKVTRIEV